MNTTETRRQRLTNQGIAAPRFASPQAVVSWFGAMQAQDYPAALWAVGLRMKKAMQADIEGAVARGTIVRSWPLRGTLHFVAAEDLKWMLTLLGPKLLVQQARRFRAVELDEPALGRCESVVAAALRDGPLARADLYRALENSGIRTTATRGLHIIFALAHRRLICFGPRQGKQPTLILLDAWVRNSRDLEGDEAMHELALRYFRSHAPATVADFAWWSGLSMSEARRAAEMLGKVRPRVARVTTTSMWLLPQFDEYLVAYKNRSDILDPAYAGQVNAGGGLLNATIVAGGEVVGTWKRSFKNEAVTITPALFRPLKKAEERRLGDAKSRYAAFLGMPMSE